MIYINAEGEYPRHIGDVQLVIPGWKTGDPLPDGWQAVVETDPPYASEYEVLYESPPQEVDGVITQVWTVRDLTDEELAIKLAPLTAKEKLVDLGLTDIEVQALTSGLRIR
jgi:hypothetical protein